MRLDSRRRRRRSTTRQIVDWESACAGDTKGQAGRRAVGGVPWGSKGSYEPSSPTVVLAPPRWHLLTPHPNRTNLRARAQRPEAPQTAPAQIPCSSCWPCSMMGGCGRTGSAIRRLPCSRCHACEPHMPPGICPLSSSKRTALSHARCQACPQSPPNYNHHCTRNSAPVQHQVHLAHVAISLEQLLQVCLGGCEGLCGVEGGSGAGGMKLAGRLAGWQAGAAQLCLWSAAGASPVHSTAVPQANRAPFLRPSSPV